MVIPGAHSILRRIRTPLSPITEKLRGISASCSRRTSTTRRAFSDDRGRRRADQYDPSVHGASLIHECAEVLVESQENAIGLHRSIQDNDIGRSGRSRCNRFNLVSGRTNRFDDFPLDALVRDEVHSANCS